MTDKEFRHLGKSDLIDIIYELQKNERILRTELENVKRQLEAKEIKIEKAGSIAEAAVSLNGVFESAQAAANQYLDQISRVGAESEKIIADAKRRAAEILQQAEAESQRRLAGADAEIEKKQKAFTAKVNSILAESDELRALLGRR